MFKKILIANRGEIACRVIKTAGKLEIPTVAVYSEADRQALHVKMADEAVFIGPAPSAQSYLVIDNILRACRETGADAVHPGYGFLSENADFTQALADAGITFIGPGAHAINMMGDKIASKKLAAEAGVNTIPGFQGVIKDADHAAEIAAEIGYPVMLKASAGGGGKGMRVAWNEEQCRDGFTRATNEAKSSFGDDRILAEKFIEEPRHIEIQVMADGHGNAIYLHERECSIQRRHQKVIEEAPSPFLDESTRQAMGEQAVALARAVQYQSAGTVEFIVDASKNFYFLEMNTRLQVEHPITEFITGQDLVELMIGVAAGKPLPLTQEEVPLNGWAIESRVYAEDPLRNFMPSIGRLAHYIPPDESDAVRVDTGIEEGSEVSMFYDPMIAKLVTYGSTRAEAITEMQEALDRYYIRGVAHNISFLNAVLAHPRFAEGRLTTNFIAEEYPDGFQATDLVPEDPGLPVAMAAMTHRVAAERAARISGQLIKPEIDPDSVVLTGGESFPVRVTAVNGGYAVHTDHQRYEIKTQWKLGEPLIFAEVNGQAVCFQFDRIGIHYRLSRRGSQIDALVVSPRTGELATLMPEKVAPDLSRFLLSPMPGLLVRVSASDGDEVKAGEELAVVEAMKMENSLRAPEDGRVARVLAAEGESLAVDQPILEFE